MLVVAAVFRCVPRRWCAASGVFRHSNFHCCRLVVYTVFFPSLLARRGTGGGTRDLIIVSRDRRRDNKGLSHLCGNGSCLCNSTSWTKNCPKIAVIAVATI